MIFVLKFGAWRMSVFATDRRYSDNGIFIVSSSLAVLHVKPSANKVTSFHICVMRTNNALASSSASYERTLFNTIKQASGK